MKDRRLLVQRLLALFAAGALLFDFPLLKVWLGPQVNDPPLRDMLLGREPS